MGFFSDIGKTFKKAVPKITIGDPTKLITKPIEGIYNAAGTVASSAIKNVGGVAGTAVGQVGNALSQPGAGAVLGAVGSAYGIPGLGGLAEQFSKKEEPSIGSPQVIMPPSSAEKNTPIIIAGVGGVLLIAMILILTNQRRR